jgi:predicted metalloprotease with PDZ domain
MLTKPLFISVIACVCVAAAARGEDDAPKPLPQRVAALIEQLGHNEYTVREQAQEAMKDLPVEALPIVADHYHNTPDAEVRMRLRLYASALFDRHVLPHHPELRRPGFLGIGQSLIVVNNIPQIVIVSVLPNTGAQAAGLKINDRILKFNGKALDKSNPIETLSKHIQQQGAGKKITLTINRDGKPMNVTATLGDLPNDQLTPAQRVTMIERRNAIEAYWFEHAFKKGRIEPVHEAKPAK